ncbi:protein of unknown function (plasmid) [Sterolibacterium denitrificans]|uniref:Uncharacterized protein n=1 Tax=Sterolibacterium denitrificans TaxID=157592 RepID=A0A7Z7MWE7_9PROT|nr:protein of unknown function [Sterolibacterium denitrificans]
MLLELPRGIVQSQPRLMLALGLP